MQEHREEVEDMELLFDPEVYGRIHDAAVAREAREEGMQQGRQEGELSAFIKLYKQGLIKEVDAARMLNMSVIEFLELVK